MQRYDEHQLYPPEPAYTPASSSPSPSDSPFSPLPTESSPSPSLLHHDFASPQHGYTDSHYPSYPHQATHPSPRDPRDPPPIKVETAAPPAHDDHVHSPGKLHQLLSTYKSRNQLVFLAFIAIQAIVVLVMIALVYAVVQANTGDLSTEDFLGSDPQLESVATYLGLFILAVIFEIGVCLDGMHKKNIMTLFVLCLFQVCMLVYSAVLPGQLEEAITGSNADTPHVQRLTRAYAIVIPSVVGACSLCMTAMLWPLYHEFGWNVFKRIGADIAIRRDYLLYQVFACVLKFDAFFLAGFSLQFLILVTGTPTVEFVLTIVALPISLIALVLFAVTVRAENRIGVYCSFVVQAAGMAYFAYKISRIFNPDSSERYAAARATLTIFSVLCLVMLLATFVLMGLCMLNFDKGLKERIPGYAFRRTSLLPPSSRRRQRAAAAASSSPSVAALAPHQRYSSATPSPTTEAGGGGASALPERSKTRMSLD
ncbi:hypothetical protein DMC30DRAFT_422358 [Rhodotorula diobovata]|uniref:Uncharacterized protein n=1 Tax=Rhodotorula diobovata TaxID=5288 RepID=A0A5C5FRK5_9BASI|nr:hypothetical protein DMC30DRAFT_422358 [Rhodotorula diobovata]